MGHGGLRTLCDILSVGTPTTGLLGIDMIINAQPSANTSDAVIEVLGAIGRINTVLPQQLPLLAQQGKAEGVVMPTSLEAQFSELLEDSERASQKLLQVQGTRKQRRRRFCLEDPHADEREVPPEPGGDGAASVPEACHTVKATPSALSAAVGLSLVPETVAASSWSCATQGTFTNASTVLRQVQADADIQRIPDITAIAVPAVPSVIAKRKNAALSLFDAPLAGFDDAAPSGKRIRSAAPVISPLSSVSRSDVPMERRSHQGWTQTEEMRLKEGYARYGRKWELIRKSCGLRHRLGTQLREKWRNLVLAGEIKL